MDKFRGFWMMEAGERDEQYLHPATPEEIATQLRAMGYAVYGPFPAACIKAMSLPKSVALVVKASHEKRGESMREAALKEGGYIW